MYFSPLAMRELVEGLGPRTRDAVGALLPGPVTLVVANPERRYPLACREDPERLGVRLIGGPLAGAMCPVFQTSANRSGEPPPPRFEEVPRGDRRRRRPGDRRRRADRPALDRRRPDRLSRRAASWQILREGALPVVGAGGLTSASLPHMGKGTAELRSAARVAAVGEVDEALGGVVALVRLVEEVLRVDRHHEGEAAAQAG